MSDDADQTRLVKYVILQTTMGPSLLCDLIVFIFFFRHFKTEILNVPHNHVTFCLLIVSFIQKNTDILFHLYYLRWGNVLLPTYAFCSIWNWINYSFYCVTIHLILWCCIERHLFVFHSQMMKRRRNLILFHYIPLTVCLLYVPSFYLKFIFFPPQCTNIYDYTIVYCGAPCYLSADPALGTFDWLFHIGTPVLLIFFSNLLLFIRIIWQKIKQQHRIDWGRQKRLVIQLGFISSLALLFASPAIIVGCIQLLWLPTFLSDIQNDYFYFIGCFINQLLPFTIVSSLPKLNQELKRWFDRIKRRVHANIQIQPALTMTGNDLNYGIGATTVHRITHHKIILLQQ
ncbi:unnamed protein product [Adineta steineri]|uniref:Uncharacterized protein n=1 Tax=Adineta steineri TaxID=433720 RepID=A0A813R1D8_9BILA|nr:unnamed protein product [Adineta steineri]CAF3654778.1 unnamed protein product [Adineta steineri]